MGGLSYALVTGGPRIWHDAVHSSEFVPARNHTFAGYKCKTWNLFMFNECTATYMSNTTRRTADLTDWRFGWAPSDRAMLLEWKSDPTVVSTDVSISTIVNRSILYLLGCFMVSLLLFGAIMLLRNAMATGRGSPTAS